MASSGYKPKAQDTLRERGAAMVAQWMNEQHLKVGAMLRELTRDLVAAEDAGASMLVDLWSSKFAVLETLFDDLQKPEYAAELYSLRDAIEAVTADAPTEPLKEFPPWTGVCRLLKGAPTGGPMLNGAAIQGTLDPMALALESCGLAALQPDATLAVTEEALRALALSLVDSDDLRRVTVREAALRKLADIGVSAPGKLLDAALQGTQTPSSDGAGFMLFTDPDPWPEHVDAGELLEEFVQLIRRFVIVPTHATNAIALWILHAWALGAFDVSPLLVITSATKRCGKTTLLEAIGMLVPQPLPSSNITAAALFRAIEKFKPTMLIDEADTFLHEKDDLRGIINSGHRRSSAFVVRTVGEEHDPKAFSTWGAKAIAAIGKLAGTMEDRSIQIVMRRRAPGERAEKFRTATFKSVADPLRRKAYRWASDSIPVLQKITPEEPEELNDRAADNWRPLLAIAELAGGEWRARARKASLELSLDMDEAEGSAVLDLLHEIAQLLQSRDRIASAELAEISGRSVG